jgi:hypothetical protein
MGEIRMPSKHFDEAKRHLEKLGHVVKHHGLPSDEANYHYHQVREHYGRAPANEKQLFLPLVQQADEYWKQLKMNDKKHNAAYTLIDASGREHEVRDVAIDDQADAIEFSASFTTFPPQPCGLRRNSDNQIVTIAPNNFSVVNDTVRWSAIALVRPN